MFFLLWFQLLLAFISFGYCAPVLSLGVSSVFLVVVSIVGCLRSIWYCSHVLAIEYVPSVLLFVVPILDCVHSVWYCTRFFSFV